MFQRDATPSFWLGTYDAAQSCHDINRESNVCAHTRLCSWKSGSLVLKKSGASPWCGMHSPRSMIFPYPVLEGRKISSGVALPISASTTAINHAGSALALVRCSLTRRVPSPSPGTSGGAGKTVLWPACGSWHSAAVVREAEDSPQAEAEPTWGMVYTWGDNARGQLGAGGGGRWRTPRRVEALAAVAVSQASANPQRNGKTWAVMRIPVDSCQ